MASDTDWKCAAFLLVEARDNGDEVEFKTTQLRGFNASFDGEKLEMESSDGTFATFHVRKEEESDGK